MSKSSNAVEYHFDEEIFQNSDESISIDEGEIYDIPTQSFFKKPLKTNSVSNTKEKLPEPTLNIPKTEVDLNHKQHNLKFNSNNRNKNSASYQHLDKKFNYQSKFI